MDKLDSNKIMKYFMTGFALPPFVWLFFIWYLEIVSFDTLISMFLSIPMPAFYITFLTLLFLLVRKNLLLIEEGIVKLQDPKAVNAAQQAISFLPRYYLIMLPIFALLLPLVSLVGGLAFFSTEYTFGVLIGVPLVFIVATPFFIHILMTLERGTTKIPFSLKHHDLSVGAKMTLVLMPNFTATFMVVVISALAVAHRYMHSDDLMLTMVVKLIIVGASMVAVIMVNIFSLQYQIVNPVRKLHNMMRNMSRGGINVHSRMERETRDELGGVSIYFNQFMDTIAKILKQLQGSSSDMAESSAKLNDSSKKYRYITQKENESISEVAKTAQQTFTTAGTLCTVINHQNESIKAIIEGMKDAGRYGDEMIEELEEGHQQVIKTTSTAQVGENSMNMMRDNMEKIHTVFEDIAEVLDFINDIAEKINLLSLNASIEASRAGEMGMGFSVVSQQIARLAEETKKSVININHLLENSNDRIKEGSDHILSGAQTVLTLLMGVEDIEKLYGKLLGGLKKELARFKKVEVDIEDIKTSSDSVERMSVTQKDRMNSLLELLGSMSSISENALEAMKELSNETAANSHLVENLQKKITGIQVEKRVARKLEKAKLIAREEKAG